MTPRTLPNMTPRTLLERTYKHLSELVGDNKFHRSPAAMRYAGAVESLLVVIGSLDPAIPLNPQKYRYRMLCIKWSKTESYCHMICRLSKEYLDANPI